MKTVLVARGAAITPRRAKLIEVLLASDGHPTVAEIHEEVRDEEPGGEGRRDHAPARQADRARFGRPSDRRRDTEEVRGAFPSTSLATIYNTIELLKATGQVLELQFSGAANRYDGRRPHPHPHLMCFRCGTIEDIDMGGLDEETEAVSTSTGYKIVSRRTDYYGICPLCQAAEA